MRAQQEERPRQLSLGAGRLPFLRITFVVTASKITRRLFSVPVRKHSHWPRLLLYSLLWIEEACASRIWSVRVEPVGDHDKSFLKGSENCTVISLSRLDVFCSVFLKWQMPEKIKEADPPAAGWLSGARCSSPVCSELSWAARCALFIVVRGNVRETILPPHPPVHTHTKPSFSWQGKDDLRSQHWDIRQREWSRSALRAESRHYLYCSIFGSRLLSLNTETRHPFNIFVLFLPCFQAFCQAERVHLSHLGQDMPSPKSSFPTLWVLPHSYGVILWIF